MAKTFKQAKGDGRRGIRKAATPTFKVCVVKTLTTPVGIQFLDPSGGACGPVCLMVRPGKTRAQVKALRADYARWQGTPYYAQVWRPDGSDKGETCAFELPQGARFQIVAADGELSRPREMGERLKPKPPK